jgi:hypothetical protein
MSDFIIQFGDNCPASEIEHVLQNRPWMGHRGVHVQQYLWGQVIIQVPFDSQYIPYKDGERLVACVGRPRFLQATKNSQSFNQRLHDSWPKANNINLFNTLTGMFALLKVSNRKISIVRDQMGAQPVYRAYNNQQKLVGIGTDVEILAMIAGRDADFDPVSLAELLVYNSITFPYSSRLGIEEFEPGVVINILPEEPDVVSDQQSYWQPQEPEHAQPDLVDDLVDRMRAVGSDIAKSADKIGVTLSGGLDSRAVLSVLPKHQVTALTYVTHKNFETDIAQEVAAAYGCQHIYAKRSEDYFVRVLLNSGPALLGIERRAMLHGLCIPESGLQDEFDVILGGQLSDTYLKDHYMPKWQRELLRPKGAKERIGIVLRNILGIPQPVYLPGIGSNLGRYLLERYLSPELRQQVHSRRKKRLAEVRKLRPTTAEEWTKFWPTSRQDDLSHILGNSKLFSFESLFSHKYIVDFAAQLLPEQRYSGAIASQAFSILYAHLSDIPDANTGRLPQDQQAIHPVRVKRQPLKTADMADWNNVSDSWFNMAALQKLSPQWQEQRQQLASSAALGILDPIIDRPASQLLSTYSEELGPTFNQMFMQLVTAIDTKLD